MDATDSKGEPIHQTLMAKKMQRLDESPDFRPFKFRIQAFTNAFLEEVRTLDLSPPSASWHSTPYVIAQLARQGFPEEKIPMKKVSAPPRNPRHPARPTSASLGIALPHARPASPTLGMSADRPLSTDPQLPLEPALHLALQRGGQKVQV